MLGACWHAHDRLLLVNDMWQPLVAVAGHLIAFAQLPKNHNPLCQLWLQKAVSLSAIRCETDIVLVCMHCC